MNRTSRFLVSALMMVCLISLIGCKRANRDLETARETTPAKTETKGQEATGADVPFALVQNKVIGTLFGNRLYEGSAKEGYHFLVVAVARMKGEERLSESEMNHTVIDAGGAEYQPIAFGMPAASGQPFLIQGYSFKGDISLDEGQETVFALFYLVPRQSKSFNLRGPEARIISLSMVDGWTPPKSMEIISFRAYGKLVSGTPTVEKDGWGLK